MVTSARIGVAGVLLALALGGCGQAGGGAVRATPGQTTGAGVPAQPTNDPAAGVGSNPGSGSDEPQAIIDPGGNPKASSDNHTVAIGSTFQMPDLKKMDLQAAQDLLQGRNSYELEQKDALGKGRNPVKDTSWRVCSQIPAAGKYVPIDTVVRLFAVKDGETCP